MTVRKLLLLVVSLAGLASHVEAEMPVMTVRGHGGVVRFAVVGDIGRHPEAVAAAVRKHHRKVPLDGVLMMGDNFYYCGITSVNDPLWSLVRDHYSPIGIPIFPLLGNHDYGDPTRFHPNCGDPRPWFEVEATGSIPNWKFPARSYVISTPFGRIVMMDTMPIALEWSKSVLRSQTEEEVKASLAVALERAAGDPWLIVGGHHGIYSAGPHGTSKSRDLTSMRTLLPLLERKHVDVFINGHDHHLGLIGSLDPPHHPLFLTSGAGSSVTAIAKREPAEPPTLFPPEGSAPILGYAVLELTEHRLSIAFYDTKGAQRGTTFSVRARLRPSHR